MGVGGEGGGPRKVGPNGLLQHWSKRSTSVPAIGQYDRLRDERSACHRCELATGLCDWPVPDHEPSRRHTQKRVDRGCDARDACPNEITAGVPDLMGAWHEEGSALDPAAIDDRRRVPADRETVGCRPGERVGARHRSEDGWVVPRASQRSRSGVHNVAVCREGERDVVGKVGG